MYERNKYCTNVLCRLNDWHNTGSFAQLREDLLNIHSHNNVEGEIVQFTQWIITDALRDPYAEHVELEQAPVDIFSGVVIHERVVDERSYPRAQNSRQVSVRQDRYIYVITRDQCRRIDHYVQHRQSCHED